MNHEPSRLAMLEAITRAASTATMFEQAALLAAAELIRALPAPKPPEPLPALEVAADPRYVGRHPLHDCRYIITKGAELFLVNPGVDSEVQITGGSIVARLTDCARQRELAFCMAAGPELLEACKYVAAVLEDTEGDREMPNSYQMLKAAIAKAEGRARCPGCGCYEVLPHEPGRPLLCKDCEPSAPIADFTTPGL